eukprot:m.45410 g.45410  ORF g.45410 m.45410 type:complete len:312 (+) comp6647_c0_seq1:178-1113(+)
MSKCFLALTTMLGSLWVRPAMAAARDGDKFGMCKDPLHHFVMLQYQHDEHHTFDTITGVTMATCASHCIASDRCLAANFKPTRSGKGQCALKSAAAPYVVTTRNAHWTYLRRVDTDCTAVNAHTEAVDTSQPSSAPTTPAHAPHTVSHSTITPTPTKHQKTKTKTTTTHPTHRTRPASTFGTTAVSMISDDGSGMPPDATDQSDHDGLCTGQKCRSKEHKEQQHHHTHTHPAEESSSGSRHRHGPTNTHPRQRTHREVTVAMVMGAVCIVGGIGLMAMGVYMYHVKRQTGPSFARGPAYTEIASDSVFYID